MKRYACMYTSLDCSIHVVYSVLVSFQSIYFRILGPVPKITTSDFPADSDPEIRKFLPGVPQVPKRYFSFPSCRSSNLRYQNVSFLSYHSFDLKPVYFDISSVSILPHEYPPSSMSVTSLEISG